MVHILAMTPGVPRALCGLRTPGNRGKQKCPACVRLVKGGKR